MRQDIIALVDKYLGRGKYSGESNIVFKCPFHKGGQEHKPSFAVNVDLGVFQCFTCKVAGTIVKLLKLLSVPDNVIDAETKHLRETIEDNKRRLKQKQRADFLTSDPFLAPTILPESILKPFMYEPIPDKPGEAQRVLPSKLIEAGFSPEWLDYMEIGFDKKNSRIIYPIRDLYGNLAGVSGGTTIAGQFPKYKIYQGPRKDVGGVTVGSEYGLWFDESYPNYRLQNHNYLWNFDQVYPRLFFNSQGEQTLIITEGFKACMWLLQHGWLNTVALMGSAMSDRQASLLHRVQVNVVLFLDNDEAGLKGTIEIGKRLRQYQDGVFVAQYPNPEIHQPDNFGMEELAAVIQGAIPYPKWMKGRLTNEHGFSS